MDLTETGAKERTGFKKTLKCGRISGQVYNYKALQRLAGEPRGFDNPYSTGSQFPIESIFNILFYLPNS